ncbi:MAG: M23 family metallopeptidase [Rhodospirillales bacterium]|nr:M23 family metallopeptidase [Rhodospirillales bacterium]
MRALLAFIIALVLADPAWAQGRGGRGPMAPSEGGADLDEALARHGPEAIGAFSPTRATLAAMTARGFLATGLEPVYPKEARCPEIRSGFADPTRSDGSRRPLRFFQGLHGGIDIPAPEGTPIRAMAAGTVVHKHGIQGIGGIGLILQHAPEDTGLPAWLYTEYKHLRALPDGPIGERVALGQVIAEAGISGTQGHYGEEGLSHLHLTAYWSTSPEFSAGRLFIPKDGRWLDPLALFRPAGGAADLESAALKALPKAEKKIAIAYRGPDGQTSPHGARLIWPFACAGR